MPYELEYWAVGSRTKKKYNGNDNFKMLSEVTRKYKVKNEYTSDSIGIASICDKMQEKSSKQFGCVLGEEIVAGSHRI